jgi:exodeoxyribonuclease-3
MATDQVPREPFERLGYTVTAVGLKSYNGVALLTRGPVTDVLTALPGDEEDTQARYVEATIDARPLIEGQEAQSSAPGNGAQGNRAEGADEIRIGCLYLPNGNPIGTDKFQYKLAWMERLRAHARNLMARGIPFALAGDFNVCPSDRDVFDIRQMADDALVQSDSRRAYRALLHLGLTNAFRAVHPDKVAYSFWDYQAGRWHRDEGLLIDFLLLSPDLTDRLEDAWIDRTPRGKEKASDHTPVMARLGPSLNPLLKALGKAP